MRKKCSSDREKLLKFEAEGREFAKILRSLKQFIQAHTCVITLQTNWVRYSHTNHRKHYFNKRKEKEGITTFMKRQNRA